MNARQNLKLVLAAADLLSVSWLAVTLLSCFA